MLYRKIEDVIYHRLSSDSDKVLVVTGARQVGKSFIIRHVAERLFKNVVEINLIEDYEGERLFESVRRTEDFYLMLSTVAGNKMGTKKDTIVFLDEIQQYPHLLTLLKFLNSEGRFRYVVSGSLLGVSLKTTTSVPLGSIDVVKMFPLDFEEFLIANGFSTGAIDTMRKSFLSRESLDENLHERVMSLFKRYLLVGGLPEAVNAYLSSHNIMKVRDVQRDIHTLYAIDASKYDEKERLKIRRIYDLIPSNMENKKKRLVFKDIEGKTGSRSDNYVESIDYLISSGIALNVQAVSNPLFPLIESGRKNLLKLYLNDVGLLTGVLYRNNVLPVLNTDCSVNLGSVYECVVATELAAHDCSLFYYDNKTKGEVDYLVDDYSKLTVLPVEVKSGKDYTVHSALNTLLSNADYHIEEGVVLSNERNVRVVGKVVYMPIYYVMFLAGDSVPEENLYI